jgi:hypothetical protein
MAIYSFTNAKDALKARIGHRTDQTDARLGQWINQAQLLISTNIKGVEVFDVKSALKALTIGVNEYTIIGSGLVLSDFWALENIKNETDKLFMRRGEWDTLTQIQTVPAGNPTRWVRKYNKLYLFSAPTKVTNITLFYRRIATVDVLEVGDDWFDHLVNIALYYAVSDIGRGESKNAIAQSLPQTVQIALVAPLLPSTWEALHDKDLSVYA